VPAADPPVPDAELTALAARVRGLAPRCGGTVVIAVDGPSGSGKTTFAARLAAALGNVPTVHLDDVHPGWDGLDAAVPRLVEGLLRPLAEGRPAAVRCWDWDRDTDGEQRPVPPAPLLVVEGVGSGARACARYLSLLVWLDGPEPVRRAVALARDGAGYAPHWERWAAQERVHFAREGTADRADVTCSADMSTGRCRWSGLASVPVTSELTTATTDPTPATTAPPVTTPSALPTTLPGGLTLRTVDPASEELTGWLENVALVFNDSSPVTAEGTELRREVYRGQRLTGAFDAGLAVGTFRSWDTTLTVPGGTVVADAVSTVTVRPTHRRRRILSTLMHADLASAADRGVPVAILIASEAVIYGRYGFGVATQTATWEVNATRARMRPEVPSTGRVQVVPEAVAYEVARSAFAAARVPGAIDRFQHWWELDFGVKVFPGETRGVQHVAVFTADDGTPQGYVQYKVDDKWEDRQILSVLTVKSLVTATPAAYAALWRFLVDYDLVATVKAEERPVDEPLPWLLTDHRAVRQTGRGDFQWHRLLDPAAALSARTYERPGAVSFEVVDPDGWAAGSYTLEASADGVGSCEPTSRAAELALPVDVLSSVWLGGGDLRAAVWAGRCHENVPGAAGRLAALLRTAAPPYTGTWF
jgi:predicted acetyltransferase